MCTHSRITDFGLIGNVFFLLSCAPDRVLPVPEEGDVSPGDRVFYDLGSVLQLHGRHLLPELGLHRVLVHVRVPVSLSVCLLDPGTHNTTGGTVPGFELSDYWNAQQQRYSAGAAIHQPPALPARHWPPPRLRPHARRLRRRSEELGTRKVFGWHARILVLVLIDWSCHPAPARA